MVRVFLAGFLGGLVIFFCGAAGHIGMNLESRAMKDLPEEGQYTAQVTKNGLAPGLYAFPGYEEGMKLSGEQRTTWEKEFVDRYKAGPAGMVLIAPPGEEPMGPKQLGGEFASDVLAALIAALLISQVAPTVGFGKRWLMIVAIGPMSWLSLTYSYYLWYRFPFSFILDGLIGSLIEWGVAGLVIAALVKPKPTAATSPGPGA